MDDGQAIVDGESFRECEFERNPSIRLRAATWHENSQCGDRNLRGGVVSTKDYNSYVADCLQSRSRGLVDDFLRAWNAANRNR